MTNQNVWNISLFGHIFKGLSLYLEARIWIRIRIRIRMKSRIRSRIEIMRIHNTDCSNCYKRWKQQRQLDRKRFSNYHYMALCHSFWSLLLFNIHSYNTITLRSSFTIRRGPFLESSSRLCSARGASMGCRAEIRTRACLTASRRTTNWAAPHPPTELRRILPTELRRILTELRRILTELRRILYWAAPHPNWAAPHHYMALCVCWLMLLEVDFWNYFIRHCFICCPTDSSVSEDAEIESRPVLEFLNNLWGLGTE